MNGYLPGWGLFLLSLKVESEGLRFCIAKLYEVLQDKSLYLDSLPGLLSLIYECASGDEQLN